MTTQTKQNAFFQAGQTSVKNRINLADLFRQVKAMDKASALLAANDILLGAASVQQATIDKASKAILAARHTLEVQSKAKKPDPAKMADATAIIAEHQALYTQAIADQKTDVAHVWNACKQYSSLDVRDGETIQRKPAGLVWFKTQSKKSDDEKKVDAAKKLADKTAQETALKELQEKASQAGQIESVDWKKADLSRLVSLLTTTQLRELQSQIAIALLDSEAKADKKKGRTKLSAVA